MKEYRLYCSAAMRGVANENRPLFEAAAERYRAIGCTVHSPPEMEEHLRSVWEHEHRGTPPLREVFAAEFETICKRTDAVVILDCPTRKWQISKGVRAEVAVAEAVGVPVLYEDYTEDTPHARFDLRSPDTAKARAMVADLNKRLDGGKA